MAGTTKRFILTSTSLRAHGDTGCFAARTRLVVCAARNRVGVTPLSKPDRPGWGTELNEEGLRPSAEGRAVKLRAEEVGARAARKTS